MKQILPKQAPLRLEQQDYQNLRDQVLRRDGWCCQLCGSIRWLPLPSVCHPYPLRRMGVVT